MTKKATTIIKNYEFETIIGVYDFERVKKQKVSISAEFISSSFIDYVEVMEFVENTYNEYKFKTVENSLDVMADILKKKFSNLLSINIEIYKLEIVKNAVVGAKLEVVY